MDGIQSFNPTPAMREAQVSPDSRNAAYRLKKGGALPYANTPPLLFQERIFTVSLR